MIDLPEVRQILRDNDLFNARALRLNRRGQLPSQLRHFTKAEDSNEDTEDEDLYLKQEELLNAMDGLAIIGKSVKPQVQKSDTEAVE